MRSDAGALRRDDPHRLQRLSPMVARARRPRQRRAAADAGRAAARRHRLRRLVHRRQARGLRPLPRGAGAGPPNAACASRRRRQALPAVRHGRRARLLHRAGLSGGLRSGRRASCCSRPAAPAPTAGPASSTDAEQVTVSAINRNFPGRSGPGSVWLASPPTVAASAIAGELASFDELQRRAADRPRADLCVSNRGARRGCAAPLCETLRAEVVRARGARVWLRRLPSPDDSHRAQAPPSSPCCCWPPVRRQPRGGAHRVRPRRQRGHRGGGAQPDHRAGGVAAGVGQRVQWRTRRATGASWC